MLVWSIETLFEASLEGLSLAVEELVKYRLVTGSSVVQNQFFLRVS